MKKIVFLIFLATTMGFAQYERPGSTSAQFLKISPSARAAGMCNAFISVVDNAEAAYFNPAALTRIQKMGLSFNHSFWFAGINHDFASIAYDMGNWGTLAASMTALYTDEMKVRTPLQPDGTGESFYTGSFRTGISYARRLTNYVSFGATVNYVNVSLTQDFSANAIAGDIAVLYGTDFHGFSFGMMISNFGSEIKFVNESYPQPTAFSFGLSFNAIELDDQALLISGDAEKPNDGKPTGRIGAEWSYNKTLFVRSGYRLNHDTESFSLGVGIKINISNYKFNVDYSYSDYSELGATSRLGLNWIWD